MGSGCNILLEEPERFGDYLLADKRFRDNIFSEESVVDAMENLLRTDPSLRNIIDDIRKSGDDIHDCLSGVLQSRTVLGLIERNVKKKKKEIRQRVKDSGKYTTRTSINKEVERRLKISLSRIKFNVKKPDISLGQKQVRVGKYTRQGTLVDRYSKTKSRPLSAIEERLIKSNLKKPVKEVIDIYMSSGLPFRTPTSIRRHYYRMKGR